MGPGILPLPHNFRRLNNEKTFARIRRFVRPGGLSQAGRLERCRRTAERAVVVERGLDQRHERCHDQPEQHDVRQWLVHERYVVKAEHRKDAKPLDLIQPVTVSGRGS